MLQSELVVLVPKLHSDCLNQFWGVMSKMMTLQKNLGAQIPPKFMIKIYVHWNNRCFFCQIFSIIIVPTWIRRPQRSLRWSRLWGRRKSRLLQRMARGARSPGCIFYFYFFVFVLEEERAGCNRGWKLIQKYGNLDEIYNNYQKQDICHYEEIH